MTKKNIIISFEQQSQRLDSVLSQSELTISRSRWQKIISDGEVLVNGLIKTPSYKCIIEDVIEFEAPVDAVIEDLPEEIPIEIVYEDDDIMVINKPADLTVHPGSGQKNQTLLNALLFHRPQLANIARAGIVHRLDKNTSGLMVIAKTVSARLQLIKMIADREVSREYLAIAEGEISDSGTITTLIARHPIHRTRMAVAENNNTSAKKATTHYKVLKDYGKHKNKNYYLIHCRLDSGRTHQIRVHLSHVGCPVVGDFVYNSSKDNQKSDKIATRQMLHAFFLRLVHPQTGKEMQWQVDTPNDFSNAIENIKEAVNVS